MRCSAHAAGAGAAQRQQPSGPRSRRAGCKAVTVAALPQHQPGDAPQASSRPGVNRRGPLIDRRQLLTGAAVSTLSFLGGCPCTTCVPGAGAAKAADWTYGDLEGPKQWVGLCQTGVRQSPINIPLRRPVEGSNVEAFKGAFEFTYDYLEKISVLNTGHGTPQVNFKPGNKAFIGNGVKKMEMELIQFHFHAPSEHAIDGKRTAMEAHLVHRNLDTGNLAVLGIMIEPGGEQVNGALDESLDTVPEEVLVRQLLCKPINPSWLLPGKGTVKGASRPFVHYTGSLTTPPCSEEVDWFVFTEPIKVPDRQVLQYTRFAGGGVTYGLNARPLQSINDRVLDYQLYGL